MAPKEFPLERGPKDGEYVELLNLALERGGSFLLVNRSRQATSECDAVLEALKPSQISEVAQDHWPGTQLHGGTAVVSTFRLTQASREILAKSAFGLFGWLSPYRPEDLCFLRQDGTPWLTSTSHERWASISLSDAD
jgi:hypothetical protein